MSIKQVNYSDMEIDQTFEMVTQVLTSGDFKSSDLTANNSDILKKKLASKFKELGLNLTTDFYEIQSRNELTTLASE